MPSKMFPVHPLVSNDVLFQIVAQRCVNGEDIHLIIDKFINARRYMACRQHEADGVPHLVMDPAEAIGEESITCCICGKKCDNLTRAHLFEHGLSMEEYRNLCGYPSDLKLFSKRYARQQEKKSERMRKKNGN